MMVGYNSNGDIYAIFLKVNAKIIPRNLFISYIALIVIFLRSWSDGSEFGAQNKLRILW